MTLLQRLIDSVVRIVSKWFSGTDSDDKERNEPPDSIYPLW